MIEPISWLTVIGLGLAALIWVFKWWASNNDSLSKKKSELQNEWNDARKNNDRSAMLNIFNKLRRKK